MTINFQLAYHVINYRFSVKWFKSVVALGNTIIVFQSRTYLNGCSLRCNYILSILSVLSNAKTHCPVSGCNVFKRKHCLKHQRHST